MPFFYTSLYSPNNPEELPNTLQFSLDYNSKIGLLMQKYDEEVEKLLNKAYNYGSQVTRYMDDYELGQKYAVDFLDFITKKEKEIQECKILEIGCGTGYLLSLLKEKGAEVIGIEPGNQAEIGKEKYNLDIIQDYYPSEKLKDKFDIIILYNVLEHISDIATFLKNIKNQLKDQGRIYYAVPDCEKPIKYGDISMLIHMHYNYFVEQSLKNIFKDSINRKAYIEKSSFGAELYGYINNNEFYCDENKTDNNNELNIDFVKKTRERLQSLEKLLMKVNKEEKSLGIYVPSRAINILSQVNENITLDNIEFFDDNPNIIGTYFPGINKKIRSRMDLINNPTDYVLIMSYTFGEDIKKDISKQIHDKTIIIKCEEL